MTLIDILDKRITKLSNHDPAWVQFITDHIKLIQENSTLIIIEDAARDKYKYKLPHFLRDQGISDDITWIAKLINSLNNFTEFTTRYTLLLPQVSHINTLYRLYRTSVRAT